MRVNAAFIFIATGILPSTASAGQENRTLLDRFIDPVSEIENRSGLYFAPRSRISILDETSFDSPVTNLESTYGVGFAGSGVIGYAFVPQNSPVGARAELEIGYSQNNVDTVTVNGAAREDSDSVGSLFAITGFASGFLDLHLGQTERLSGGVLARLSPFVGAGIGYSSVSLNEQGSFSDGLIIDDTTSAPAFHLSTGVSIALTEKTTLELGYRYEEIFDAEFSAADGSTSSIDIERQSFTFGFRRRF